MKLAILNGVPISRVAKQTGIARGTITAWVSRYNWPTPGQVKKVAKKRAEEVLDAREQVVENGSDAREQVVDNETDSGIQGDKPCITFEEDARIRAANRASMAETVQQTVQQGSKAVHRGSTPVHLTKNRTQTLAERMQQAGQLGIELTLEYQSHMAAIAGAKAARAVATLPDPKNWRDLNTADQIARRAAGLDKNVTQVNTTVKLGGFADGLDDPEPIDV